MMPRPLRLRPVWLSIGWLLVLFVVYMSLAPRIPSADITYFDKIGHFLAYFALMSWFGFVYLRGTHLWIGLSLVVFGIALECVQYWTGYRVFSPFDIVANVLGVTAGWLLAATRFAQLLAAMENLLGVQERT